MPSGRDSFRRNRVAPSLQIIPLGAGRIAFSVPPESGIELTVESLRFTVDRKDQHGLGMEKVAHALGQQVSTLADSPLLLRDVLKIV
jgi:hypothetical protein